MTPTEYESPFVLCPTLQEEKLEELAEKMLNVVEMTMHSHTTPYDDNYTVETSIFGRMRQLFIQLHDDPEIPWITLTSQSMDYVPNICNIPVRIFKDDPHNPKKLKIFFQNYCEQSQLSLLFSDDELENAGILTWRLLIQAPATADDKGDELEDLEDDYHVVLVGYDPLTHSIVSMWKSEAVAKTPILADFDELPEEKPIERRPLHRKNDNIIEFPKRDE